MLRKIYVYTIDRVLVQSLCSSCAVLVQFSVLCSCAVLPLYRGQTAQHTAHCTNDCTKHERKRVKTVDEFLNGIYKKGAPQGKRLTSLERRCMKAAVQRQVARSNRLPGRARASSVGRLPDVVDVVTPDAREANRAIRNYKARGYKITSDTFDDTGSLYWITMQRAR